MDSDAAIRTLSALRTVVGASAWLTPNLAGKAFGLDVAANPQAPYLARLFGVRDVALAAGPLQSRGEAQRTWLKLGLLCDVADTAAAGIAGRRGYLSPVSTALVIAPALGAAALGVLALRDRPIPGG